MYEIEERPTTNIICICLLQVQLLREKGVGVLIAKRIGVGVATYCLTARALKALFMFNV